MRSLPAAPACWTSPVAPGILAAMALGDGGIWADRRFSFGSCGVSSWPPPKPAPTATAVLDPAQSRCRATTAGRAPANGTSTLPSSRAGRRAVQDLHRRNSADRRAEWRDRLPALSHASRSGGVAGVARAVFEQDPRFQQALAEIARRSMRRWWWATSARTSRPISRAWNDYNSALVVGADGRAWAATTRSTWSLRRVHSLPESAVLCPQAHRPSFVVHARQTSARSSFAERPAASLRRLHLLRGGLCRRGAPVREKWAPRCW
jgi:hypothetical protein